MNLEKKVSIVIINWNGINDTIECLNSLKNLNYPNFKIIVLDNGSKKDETLPLRKQFGNAAEFIRSEENLGFAGGNNFIIKKYCKDFDFFLLLNNDTVVESNFLDTLTAAFSSSNAGIAGPVVCNFASDTIQSFGASVNMMTGGTRHLHVGSSANFPKKIETVDMVSGCCFLIKREVIDKIGLLNEEYFAYYEETDFCIRAKKSGFLTVAVPNSFVYHKGGASSNKISGFSEYQMMRNRFIFIYRNGRTINIITTFIYVTFFYIWARSIQLILLREQKNIPHLFKGYFVGVQNIF